MFLYYLVILIIYVLCGAIAEKTKEVTDEYFFVVSPTRNTSICSASEWQCADGSCIRKEGLCDAKSDCNDASDEYFNTCVGTKRPSFRLLMLCFAFAGKSKRICPPICYDQPAFCLYAILAENGYKNFCRLPPYPAHGSYTIQRLANQQGFKLDYTCEQSYALVQSDELQCINGVWTNEDKPRYCEETCPLHKAENFKYTCKDGSCSDHVPVGTVVTVSRKYVKEEKSVSVRIVCQEGRTFNMSTRCVPGVDDLQQEFEQPSMTKMIYYETKFNQFEAGEIIREFQQLVEEYRQFENDVKQHLDMMSGRYEECDLVLDLILSNLMRKDKLFSP